MINKEIPLNLSSLCADTQTTDNSILSRRHTKEELALLNITWREPSERQLDETILSNSFKNSTLKLPQIKIKPVLKPQKNATFSKLPPLKPLAKIFYKTPSKANFQIFPSEVFIPLSKFRKKELKYSNKKYLALVNKPPYHLKNSYSHDILLQGKKIVNNEF